MVMGIMLVIAVVVLGANLLPIWLTLSPIRESAMSEGMRDEAAGSMRTSTATPARLTEEEQAKQVKSQSPTAQAWRRFATIRWP